MIPETIRECVERVVHIELPLIGRRDIEGYVRILGCEVHRSFDAELCKTIGANLRRELRELLQDRERIATEAGAEAERANHPSNF